VLLVIRPILSARGVMLRPYSSGITSWPWAPAQFCSDLSTEVAPISSGNECRSGLEGHSLRDCPTNEFATCPTYILSLAAGPSDRGQPGLHQPGTEPGGMSLGLMMYNGGHLAALPLCALVVVISTRRLSSSLWSVRMYVIDVGLGQFSTRNSGHLSV